MGLKCVEVVKFANNYQIKQIQRKISKSKTRKKWGICLMIDIPDNFYEKCDKFKEIL